MNRFSAVLLSSTALLMAAFATPAFAQYAPNERILEDRIGRLERELNFLQKNAGVPRAAASSDADDDAGASTAAVSPATAGNLGVRISQLEEQMRHLQGTLEEANFRNKKLDEKLTQSQQDIDFRLKEMDAKIAANVAVPAAITAAVAVPPAAPHDGQAPVDAAALEAAAKPDTAVKKPVNDAAAEAAAAEKKDASSDAAKKDEKVAPNEQYNQAFRLLNQSKYEESREAFKQFIAKNPKSNLVSNAYYWMGETYYVKRDYVQSADAFRQGFEANPKGSKSADNLLKLSMSLSALKRKDEACIVLRQVVSEYEKKNATASGKAKAEMTRLACAE